MSDNSRLSFEYIENWAVVRRAVVGYNLTGPLAVGQNQDHQRIGENMAAEIGDVAPDFTLPSVSDGDISLSSYKGQKNVVLSFHVFDFTSG